MSLGEDLGDSLGDKRRLYLLQCLRDVPGYMAEATALRDWLNGRKFMAVPMATVAGDLVRLKHLGLVHLLAEGAAAKITAAGLEAANGTAEYPGVARPLPE